MEMSYFMKSYINRKIEVEERTDDFFKYGEFEGILPYLISKKIVGEGIFQFREKEKYQSHNVLLESPEYRLIPYIEEIGFKKNRDNIIKSPHFFIPLGENSSGRFREEEDPNNIFVPWFGKIELDYLSDRMQRITIWERKLTGKRDKFGRHVDFYHRTNFLRKVD